MAAGLVHVRAVAGGVIRELGVSGKVGQFGRVIDTRELIGGVVAVDVRLGYAARGHDHGRAIAHLVVQVGVPAAAGMTVLMLPVGGLTVNIRATVEKVKHPAGEKFFIPSDTRSYASFWLRPCTEFRHDSCHTALGRGTV